MVQRDWKSDEGMSLKDTVFETSLNPIYWVDKGNRPYKIANRRAIVDKITGKAISEQRKVGAWADELIFEAAKPDFSLYKYIGEEASNAAFFLEPLIKTERKN